MHQYAFSLALLCLVFLTPCKAEAEVPPGTATLFDLIDARLALMEDVAAAKWRAGSAIEDREREELVLQQAGLVAAKHGIAQESIAPFFRAQIEAAKEIQRAAFALWATEPANLPVPSDSLQAMLRPQLTRLGEQIIVQIALLGGGGGLDATSADLQTRLAQHRLDDDTVQAIYQALGGIRLQSQPVRGLQRILNSGVLRIGTTLDYAPFSFHNAETAEATGIDLELAQRLAESLGVDLDIVQTSWPTLMDDLAADRFDIGMSGISRTLARQRTAFFSAPYHTGGKVSIGRCEDRRRFTSMETIDQPDVRVVVNPGGTNEHFVNASINNAQVTVYPDNTVIFRELVNGNADVMFTDLIEASLQSRLNTSLCLLGDGQALTRQEKALLLAADPALKFYVDSWLGELRTAGMLEQIFNEYLELPVIARDE